MIYSFIKQYCAINDIKKLLHHNFKRGDLVLPTHFSYEKKKQSPISIHIK